MLLEALMKIQEMSSFSLAQLAESLKVDKIIATHILDHLKAMGYLQEKILNTFCDGNCKSCVGCSGISNIRPIKTLTITEKGNRVLRRALP